MASKRTGRRLAAAFAAALLIGGASARAAGPDDLLEPSGIRYPGGFDRNTAGEVQGIASAITATGDGPVRFQLTVGREAYTVLTVPRWYWSELGAQVPEGAAVRVRGSKTLGRDGNLYVVAEELTLPREGLAFTFRDRDGTPLWTTTRPGPGARSAPPGRGGPLLGPGARGARGMGGGMGGMHRPGR